MLEAEPLLATLDVREPTAENRSYFSAYPLDSLAHALSQQLLPHAVKLSTVCSACSSGSVAIIQGARWLQQGLVDRVLVGGVEALSFLTLAGFHALGVVDRAPSRPFDKTRAGLNLGEAAAFLVLRREGSEGASGGPPLAYLSGWAQGSEAHHITRPEPSATRVLGLIEEALGRAGRPAEAVDYVQAHGTGTPLNDQTEAEALARLFQKSSPRGKGQRMPLVASSKAQLGHTLGAAGAVGAVISALSLAFGKCPRQLQTDSEFPLNFAGAADANEESLPPEVVLCNALGFGGADAVLVFESAQLRSMAAQPFRRRVRFCPPSPSGDGALMALDSERSRRFALDAAQVTHATQLVRSAHAVVASNHGLVVGNALGSMQRTATFLSRAAQNPRLAAPAEFPHLVPSSLAGLPAVYHGLTGPCVTVVHGLLSGEAALDFALDCVEFGECPGIVCAAVDVAEAVKRRWLPHLATSGDSRSGSGIALQLLGEDEPLPQAQATYTLYGRGSGCGPFQPPELASLTNLTDSGVLHVVVGASDGEFRQQLNQGTLRAYSPRYIEDLSGRSATAAQLALQWVFESRARRVLLCGGDSGRWYWWLLVRSEGTEGAS
jgi:3-oxoacyl-[acyl-carrier-protein] synthase II